MHLDPEWFDPSLVDPETVALNEQLERLSANLPNPMEVGIEALREARATGRGLFGPIIRSDSAWPEAGVAVVIAQQVQSKPDYTGQF